MAQVLVYLMEAPPTRLFGFEAPKYTPPLLEIKIDLRVIVEEPLGNLLDVECIVVEVLDLQRGHPGDVLHAKRSKIRRGGLQATG
jgi:hypothetical protein